MLSIFIPDSLVSVPSGRDLPDRERSAFAPSASVNRLMARGRWSDFTGCEGDPLEQAVFAWLCALADGQEGEGSLSSALRQGHASVPPAWAMLPDLSTTPDAASYTRWYISPVHVRIGRDGVSLLPPDALDLSVDEAAELNATVRALLLDAGWRDADGSPPDQAGSIMSPFAGLCMDVVEPLPQSIPSPWAMARQRFTDLLPAGPQMANWRRLWMDVQMALHAHPVNLQRQQRGEIPVNAFWWWGGGEAVAGLADLRVRARLTDLSTGRVDGRAVQPNARHRLAMWLGSVLAQSNAHTVLDQSGVTETDAAVVQPGRVDVNRRDDETSSAQASMHLIDNAHAGLWFAPGSDHPIVRGLDEQIMAPLALAAAPHRLVLTGQAGWRSVESSAALRWAVWKNRARVDDIVEPVAGLLDEGDLARAWQDSAARATPDDGEFHPDRF